MNIPNYVDIKVIDKDGHFTPEWKIIMQQLMTALSDNASDEGLVPPTQSNANIGTIEANQVTSPTGNIYTCQYGTLIYNSDLNVLMVALNNLGVPKFYTVVTI